MIENESQEMYLETILKLQLKNGGVRSIDVAESLGYSKPSVSRAVGLMKKDEFIVVHSDGIKNHHAIPAFGLPRLVRKDSLTAGKCQTKQQQQCKPLHILQS